MAFVGPSFEKKIPPQGYCTLAPSGCIPYFKAKNVALLVRLNKKNYKEQDFMKAGISHLDQFYLNGSCPPMKILKKVLNKAVPHKRIILWNALPENQRRSQNRAFGPTRW